LIKYFLDKLKDPILQEILYQLQVTIKESSYQIFLQIFKSKIFDIILEYPETSDFILEMREALDHVKILPEITEILLENLKSRLLIPGVLTINILN